MSTDKQQKFLVGTSGKRELRNVLRRTTDPATTIRDFQKTHSLHTMFAKAFQTVPHYEAKKGDQKESLDTDSVLRFLYHLGVSQHEVHKRVADVLKSELEGEIRKAKGTEPLLNLLKNTWQHSTAIPELRPVLWSVLRQLGRDTPVQVLERLAERNKDGSLKYADVWPPLPPLLKRLAWEADWDKHTSNKDPQDPKEYLELVKGTLFAEELSSVFEDYTTQKFLVDNANRPFVGSVRDRRLLTTQRRVLSKKTTFGKNDISEAELAGFTETSKAMSQIKKLLSNGDSPAYRPKLLYAALSILLAQHATSNKFVGGAKHLHCTLVSDILLSGPLPKPYEHVLVLARTLDESIKFGNIADTHIAQIQESLRQIYQVGDTGERPDFSEGVPHERHSAEVRALLKTVVTSGITAMKQADPQQLFLNPVTDDIAPGYSSIIQKPMYMKKMEQTTYSTLQEWDKDVHLMYRNCVAYNTGNAGQWFRGEARRQHKVFKEEIFPQTKKLFEEEKAKFAPPPDANAKKRKEASADVYPIARLLTKKQKLEEKFPSMPALASMVLSDPFALRLLLDRTLRCLRIDAWKGSSLPIAHGVLPSLLQLLELAEYSNELCGNRGREYMIPDYIRLMNKEANEQMPFQYVRKYAPLVLKLFLEAELDKRMAGDLKAAAQSLPKRTNVISKEQWEDTAHLGVLLALVQGALVHVSQLGNSFELSLSTTFPKFADALKHLASPNLWEARPFFVSLIQAILRHKSKLPKAVRGVIIATWLEWLKGARKKGSSMSAAHECLVHLLNEWVALGNQVLPRDELAKVSQDVVEAVNSSEKTKTRKFAVLWEKSSPEFQPIKEQYERLLKTLPDNAQKEWKEKVGIAEESIDTKEEKGKQE